MTKKIKGTRQLHEDLKKTKARRRQQSKGTFVGARSKIKTKARGTKSFYDDFPRTTRLSEKTVG